MIASLFSLIHQHTTVVTPNQRLAAYLLKKYHIHQHQQGKTCWLSIDLLPLSSWTQRLWDYDIAAIMDKPLLVLNTNQELILWEEVIGKAPESEHLLKLSELAKQARSAWSTLKKWRTDIHHPMFSLTENCRAFQRWAKQFVRRCQQNNWIDSASLVDLIIDRIQQQHFTLPQQLLLVNFAEITPQQHALLKACEQRGVHIIQHQLSINKNMHSSVRQIICHDDEQEIQTMACWAKNILDQHPTATIGCIAATLEEKRDTIISIFTDVLGNEAFFNISAGKTLSSYSIIQTALQLLLLPLKNIPIDILSFILHSPFLGDAEQEMLPRIQIDSFLRKQNMTYLDWEILWQIPLVQHCPGLVTRFKTVLQQRKEQPIAERMSWWIHHFATVLEILGWPGEQSLNSTEYQVVHSWLNLLKEMTALDNMLTSVHYYQALHYLSVIVGQTFFQPQTPEAPIQILGQLEGAGIPFDYLWITGMDDKAWPPPPQPNPFIPYDLQKRLQMPNASAARQLEYSLRLTTQFKQVSPVVIFSYAQYQEQEESRPSPLLADLPSESNTVLHLPLFSSAIDHIFAAQSLECFQDEQAPSLATYDTLPGGASIFEMQAICPFKAFAKLRLHAWAVETAELGLPAKNRGSIVHRTLELFWQEIGEHTQLQQLSTQDLSLKIKQHLKNALSQLAPFLQPSSIYLALVTERLSKLLTDWLILEKSRPPFKVIAQEQETTLKINNISLQLRVDRIDELDDGSQLIIDYKTKKICETQDWFSKRPTAPQLPLYCISHPTLTTGIAFAQLNSNNIQFKGLAQKELHIAGIKIFNEKSKADSSSWEEQLEQWRITLIQLFHDFQTGQAQVNPKDKQTCDYCDLHSLCRISEKANR